MGVDARGSEAHASAVVPLVAGALFTGGLFSVFQHGMPSTRRSDALEQALARRSVLNKLVNGGIAGALFGAVPAVVIGFASSWEDALLFEVGSSIGLIIWALTLRKK